MDVGQSDTQVGVDTQDHVVRLCAAVAQPTSTYKDFARIEDYVNEDPERIKNFPDTIFSKLIIEGTVITGTNSLLGRHEFPRKWKSNIQFLIKYGKLHLVTNVYIVAYDISSQPLQLDEELMKIAANLGSSLPNVRSVLFLGRGVFTAGSSQTAEVRNQEANEAVTLLKLLFPQVNDLKYYLYSEWSASYGFDKLPIDANPLVRLAFGAYVEQLEHLQLYNPIPANIAWFCQHIVSLSVNVEYIRGRPNLPPISTGCLRILNLWIIHGIIPWRLFKSIQGKISFDALEELSIRFASRMPSLAVFPGSIYQVIFPVLHTLRIVGSSHVYYDIYAHFLDCAIKMMHIVDEPSDFDRINKRVLESVKDLAAYHPTGRSASGIYSAASVDQLFKPPSRVETANFDWFSWSLPQDTQWINLRSLKFTAGIATADCLANLVAQLPVLQVIDVSCVTMVTNDVGATAFMDEVARITELGEVMDPDDDSAINESLEQVSIMVKKSFDYTGLCQLVSRLPKVTEVKVHHLFIKNIQDTLRDEFEVTRNINVSAYLRTN